MYIVNAVKSEKLTIVPLYFCISDIDIDYSKKIFPTLIVVQVFPASFITATAGLPSPVKKQIFGTTSPVFICT